MHAHNIVVAKVFMRVAITVAVGQQLPTAASANPNTNVTTEPLSQKTVNRHVRKLARRIARTRHTKLKRKVVVQPIDRPRILLLLRTSRIAELSRQTSGSADMLKLLRGTSVVASAHQPPISNESQRKGDHRSNSQDYVSYYDISRRRLFADLSEPMAALRTGLSRGTCHAVQDQHTNLRRYLSNQTLNSDQLLARLAIVNGDCAIVLDELDAASRSPDRSTAEQYEADQKQIPVQTAFDSSSRISIGAQATLAGVQFVRRVRLKYGWARVNRLYRRPPQSTEQILHYEKYWLREKPHRVSVRRMAKLARTHTVTGRYTVGELQLLNYARSELGTAHAERVASGWGGDQLVVLRTNVNPSDDDKKQHLQLKNRHDTVVHVTSWDSEADAIEFYNGQTRIWSLQLGQPASKTGKRSMIFTLTNERVNLCQRIGTVVLSIRSAPRELLHQVVTNAWRQTRISGRRIVSPRYQAVIPDIH